MRFSLFLSAFLLFVCAPLRAELKWDKTIQDFNRTPDDKVIEPRYTFHNIGTTPITIKTLRSSCGCTTAKLEKKTYAPGEQGEVTLRFVFGDRKGFYHKTVTVTTDEKDVQPVVLDLRIFIHEPLTMTPALVFWKTGEAPTAKTVQLTAEPAQKVHIKSVASSNPKLTAKLDTTTPGENYTVSIQPADTAQKETAEIQVVTDFPADAPHTYTIFARIK